MRNEAASAPAPSPIPRSLPKPPPADLLPPNPLKKNHPRLRAPQDAVNGHAQLTPPKSPRNEASPTSNRPPASPCTASLPPTPPKTSPPPAASPPTPQIVQVVDMPGRPHARTQGHGQRLPPASSLVPPPPYVATHGNVTNRQAAAATAAAITGLQRPAEHADPHSILSHSVGMRNSRPHHRAPLAPIGRGQPHANGVLRGAGISKMLNGMQYTTAGFPTQGGLPRAPPMRGRNAPHYGHYAPPSPAPPPPPPPPPQARALPSIPGMLAVPAQERPVAQRTFNGLVQKLLAHPALALTVGELHETAVGMKLTIGDTRCDKQIQSAASHTAKVAQYARAHGLDVACTAHEALDVFFAALHSALVALRSAPAPPVPQPLHAALSAMGAAHRSAAAAAEPGVNGDGDQQTGRAKIPERAKAILEKWFDDHFEAPYPKEHEKKRLAEETGLRMNQINNYFGNRRMRTKRKRLEQDGAAQRGAPTYMGSVLAPRTKWKAIVKPGQDGTSPQNGDHMPHHHAHIMPQRAAVPPDSEIEGRHAVVNGMLRSGGGGKVDDDDDRYPAHNGTW